ncbi:sulfate transporter 4.1, chloroplastic [Populus alba]|uniref:Sulfate transporter 4.1, chloroplastic-like isoform X1 n=2 Tax=Populus TaxID=3689 RepID=A0A4U5R1V1_POPAL|nr:sulfate transporter 4.1, chloroplastic-like isoform X1 [Populus alba]KAJ6987032.1 sulfate transporter 4.1 [Populus alba x Populus x berolinensis]TKS17712.1 sulfate transporter 4.1, chloroplastic-like isoform X1 [Populus alba]
MERTFASSGSRDLPTISVSYSSSSSLGPSMPTRPVKIIPLQHPNTTTSSSLNPLPGALFSRWTAKVKRITLVQWIDTFLPCCRWIRTYKWREYFQPDLMAGLTVGVMLVPQAMSYAKLAGLHPIYGLYTGFIPIFVYAIFGSSRQLAIGPVALVSLLVSNVLGGIVNSSDELYTELAILLAFMVGILECIMALLRLGWLIRFISHSVISGFTSASAIVIALSQAKYFLGYDIVRSSKIVPLIKSIISGAHKFSWPPFVMGSCILAILLVMKHLGKSRKQFRFLRAAGPLTAVVLGTLFVKMFHPSSISLVGEIPQGLPSFSFPKKFEYAKSLIPTAMLITGVAILESVGIAKALAAKNGYELDSSQELFGLGLANIMGSLFSAYPSTGSFSRSAVNNESGAKTGLSGVVAGIIMCCSLLFLTPLFEYIPQCALAAIVISAVMGLVDYDEAIFLWHVDKKDFVLWIITSATTLFLGIEIGVLVGVGASLAFVIHESANPHIAVLGRLPGTTVYRNIEQYPEAYTYNGIVIVRIDAPIYFANISFIKDRLREYEVDADKSSRRGPEVEKIYFVILEMSPITYIDSSAVQALKDLHQEYKSRDIQICISNPNRDVLLTLTKAGIVELLGKERYFVRVHDAVQVCLQHVQSSTQSPKKPDPSAEEKPRIFKRLSKQREEDLSIAELESGDNKTSAPKHTKPHLEPLLSRRS